MKKKFALSLVLLSSLSWAQQSEKTSYGEVGITALSIKADELNHTFSPTLMKFTVGTQINPNLDVEGFYAGTLVSDDASMVIDSVKAQYKLKASSYGVYLKPKTKLSNDVELFAKLGYATSKVELSASFNQNSASASESKSRMSYGIGIKKEFTKDIFGVIDYTSYYKKDGISVNGFTFAIGSYF